ncbi:hypothetical protein LJC07_04260 [Christensenellaceae bacterium OttesenSCG-928-L17]|nr:hypothetical protein [Christensenellaceae bacterium OttesenSCG-928-L17]
MYQFSVLEKEFFNGSTTYNMTDTFNDVRIVGAVVNGAQVQVRESNTNPASDCNVARLGYKTYTSIQSKYYSYDQCAELAKYELRRKTQLQKSVTFSTSVVYHIQENGLVTLLRPDVSNIPEKFLVTGFSMPIGSTDGMSITGISVSDLDIYENWLTSHNLNILCSNIGALNITYGETPVTTGLDNPYIIHDIPDGLEVTFEVKKDASGTGYPYTIHAVTLNGVAQTHDGITCSFRMPSYESSVVFYLSATDASDLLFTYTGTYTDEDMEMKGIPYRLITFTSSGTLTFDDGQVERGIIGDIWTRGGGGGANPTEAGRNGYDTNAYTVRLRNSEIEIGDGGVFGETSGRRGDSTKFGDMLTGSGGPGASSYATSTGGNLSPIFNIIENTTNGVGGDIGNNGTNGVAYLRIVKKNVGD